MCCLPIPKVKPFLLRGSMISKSKSDILGVNTKIRLHLICLRFLVLYYFVIGKTLVGWKRCLKKTKVVENVL